MKYIIIILAFLLSGCTPGYSPTKYFIVTDLYPGKKVFHISQKTLISPGMNTEVSVFTEKWGNTT